MIRRIYCSYHYERDLWRANMVRNSWLSPNRGCGGVWDATLWENAKKSGDSAIKRLIDEELKNTSVTVVLIGETTINRKWVKYEIIESYKKGSALLGVYINGIKDQNGLVNKIGENPFNSIFIEQDGKRIYFFQLFQTYDWIYNHGYQNFISWIEQAAQTIITPNFLKIEPKSINKDQVSLNLNNVVAQSELPFFTDKDTSSKTSSRALRLFICHSKNDKPIVRELCQSLRKYNVDPWLDEDKLLPGQDWQFEIPQAVKSSDVVIVCLSRESINKTGYVQKEIKLALDIADEQPEGTIYLIPVKLEKCDLPQRLHRWQYVNLFDKKDNGRLISALRVRAHALEISFNKNT